MRVLLRLLRNIHFWFISITKPLARAWWRKRSLHSLTFWIVTKYKAEWKHINKGSSGRPHSALQARPSPAPVRCQQVFLSGLLALSTSWSSYRRFHALHGPCKTCHLLAWNLSKQEISTGTRIWGFYAQKSHERLLNALLQSEDTIWFPPELSVL